MHPSFQQTQHRPWPLPASVWCWRQSWLDLAFLHYRVDAEVLRSRLPAELELELYEGEAWISIVPFRMVDVAPGRWPSVYPFRDFPEINLRTYVTDGTKSGVWFFSLEAACWPVVMGGRFQYGVPYHWAGIRHHSAGTGFSIKSHRRFSPVCYEAEYHGFGHVFPAVPGTLEHWLAERYCLYSQVRGKLMRVDVHHVPWPLQEAEVKVIQNDLLKAAGISVLDDRPLCHFSTGVQVVSYAPEVIRI